MVPPRLTAAALLALLCLSACAVTLKDGTVLDFQDHTPEPDRWRVGDPPPELATVAFGLGGEVRALRTLRPLTGAVVEATIDRPQWVRRASTDDGGRFRLEFGARGRDEEGPREVELYPSSGHLEHKDSAEITLRVVCPGWTPIVHRHRLGVDQAPVLFLLEPIDPDAPPRFDCSG